MGNRLWPNLIVILFLGALIQVGPINVVAIGPPTVTIQFDPGEESQDADVEPGEPCAVFFPGTVTADKAAGGSVQKIVVTLQASSEQGWAVTVNPPQLTLEPGETAPFRVDVTVPAETSCYCTDTITISGRGVNYPGMTQDIIDSITGSIRINQFYQLAFRCPKSYVKTSPDTEIKIDFYIINHGNGRDVVHVGVNNLDDLDAKGFLVTLSANRVEVESKDEEKIEMVVRTPKGASGLGKHSIVIGFSSGDEESEDVKELEYPLTVDIPPEKIIFTTEFIVIITIFIIVIAVGIILFWRRLKKRKKVSIKND